MKFKEVTSIRKYTAYGAKVRAVLLERGQSVTELARQIRNETGLYVDSQYLYKIFTAERNAPRVCDAINRILDID